MSIKYYARSCCTLGNYGGELSIWMANDWPSDETDWKDWSQKSSAVLCKKFSVTDSATVDITCVGSTSYSYVFVRPTKIGTESLFNSALDIPEIIIHSGTWTDWKSVENAISCSIIANGGKFKDSVYGTFAECECETECDLSVGSLADVIDDIFGTLLKDANFEAGGNEWTKLGNPTIDKVVDGVGRDGGKALRIQSGFTWHGREQRNINVVAGKKYTLRAWWKIESLNSMVALPSHPAYLRIYYGKSNKYMPKYINEIPIPPTNINQWVEGRVDFVVPDDAAMISISMGGRGNGVSGTIQLLFDDISLIHADIIFDDVSTKQPTRSSSRTSYASVGSHSSKAVDGKFCIF